MIVGKMKPSPTELRSQMEPPRSTDQASVIAEPVASLQEPGTVPGAIELELVRIWEELLDRKEIGIRDDFFELGGDSLLGIRLMTEIEQRFGKQLDISRLVAHPTIEALAGQLRQQFDTSTLFSHPTVENLAQKIGGSDGEPRTEYIVPMRPRRGKPPLFCIHCGTGHVLRYRSLLSYLDSDLPVFGLRAPDLRAMKVSPTVEDLATLYREDIQKIQPRGPYRLFGFCFGGAVAYEIARQLAKLGETVSHVILVETRNAAYYRNASFIESVHHFSRYAYGRVAKYGGRGLRGEWREIRTGIQDFLSWQWSKWRTNSPQRRLRMAEILDANDIYDNIAQLSTIGEAFVPKAYPGKVYLIRAEKQSAEFEKDMTFGWQDIALGGLEVCTLPGDHFSVLEKPEVERVTEVLEKWLAPKEETVEVS